MTGAAAISSSSDRHSRLISDLCTIVATLITPSRASHVPSRVQEPVREWPVTPGAIASLLLGASFAMMVCGSVTFMLGFMLMPWVIGFMMLFCFAGFVSCLGLILRGMFSTTQKQLPGMAGENLQEEMKRWTPADMVDIPLQMWHPSEGVLMT